MSEDQHIEWKESWRDEYLRWICGFANAEGGTLIVGKNDRGEPIGVSDATRLLVDLPNKIRDLLGIVVPVRLREEQGHSLIEIEVEPHPTPISYRGEYHIRSGSTKQQLTGSALTAFLLRKFGRHWDGSPYPGVGITDLSADAFRRFRTKASYHKRLSTDALAVSNDELLERLMLTEAGMLKRAALLLFCDEPQRYCTGACVKIGFFSSDTDILYHDLIEGSLLQQFDMTIEVLRLKYLRAHIHFEAMQRIETYPVPGDALREALLNALVHKDYLSGAPIQIRVYEDKMMIMNAGILPPTWTVETLRRPHRSVPPNPDIANAFFRAGYLEAWGRGIQKIISACRQAGTPEPIIEYDGSGLCVVFPFAKSDRHVTEHDTEHVTEHDTEHVTEHVQRLLLCMPVERAVTTAELMQLLSLKHRPTLIQLYLQPARHLGLLEMTIPEKPKSRQQKYQLTSKGIAMRAQRQAPP
jgi:ATP-dependent DNA helicase RecG